MAGLVFRGRQDSLFAWRESCLLCHSAWGVKSRGCAPTDFENNINPGSFPSSCWKILCFKGSNEWLLRRGKDFSDLPDCQGLDEKRSSLIVARAKQQIFLGKRQSVLGHRTGLIVSSLVSWAGGGGHFYFEKNFYNFWDTNQMPPTRVTCRSSILVFLGASPQFTYSD